MAYDMLIQGGRVIDPAAGRDESADVGIVGGVVARVGTAIDSSEAREVLNATGCIVTPGLIDFHAHALFLSGIGLGTDLDAVCRRSGVTTLVDAGSSGAATFPILKEMLIDAAETRILAFLHISSIGLADLNVGESTYLELHEPERAAETAAAHPGLIVGIKVRQQSEAVGGHRLEPLRRAKWAAAQAGGLPTMVHVTYPPVRLPRILELLDRGDVVSHIFHGRDGGMLDRKGRILSQVFAARQRGIWFDVAHGGNHCDFDVARAAISQGFAPDTISSDLTRKNMAGVVKSLPHTLSKFLHLGMDLGEVIACATSRPAAFLGRSDRLGTLREGAAADIAVFALRRGALAFTDSSGKTLTGDRQLEPAATVRSGRVTWRS